MINILSFLIFFFNICLIYANSIHGGTFLAMSGKDSVVLAVDSRFSSQKTGCCCCYN
jgi:hypothetical protein